MVSFPPTAEQLEEFIQAFWKATRDPEETPGLLSLETAFLRFALWSPASLLQLTT